MGGGERAKFSALMLNKPLIRCINIVKHFIKRFGSKGKFHLTRRIAYRPGYSGSSRVCRV